MNKKTLKITAFSLAFAFFGLISWADAPNLLTYQGRLEESGAPVTGSRTVEIFLCDAITGGTCTTTTAQSVTVDNGLFRSTFSVPSSVDVNSGDWYTEIKVESATLAPRERLTSTLYSIQASTASHLTHSPSVTGVSVSTNVVFTSTIGSDSFTAYPFTSGEAITPRRILVVTDNFTVMESTTTADWRGIGVSVSGTTGAGQLVWVAVSGVVTGITANEAISAGRPITTDVDGKASIAGSNSIGKALSTATGSGSKFAVFLNFDF